MHVELREVADLPGSRRLSQETLLLVMIIRVCKPDEVRIRVIPNRWRGCSVLVVTN